MLKNFLCFLFMLFTIFCFSSCKNKGKIEVFNKNINISLEKDASVFSIIALKEKNDQNSTRNNYKFSFLNNDTEVLTKIAAKKTDAAFLPAIFACALYNKTKGEILVCAINILNNLYLLSKDQTVQNILDLKNKTITILKKDLNLKPIIDIILKNNNICGVEVKVVESAKDLQKDESENVVLTEPECTKIIDDINLENAKVINLAKEWENVSKGVPVPSSCLVVSKEFYKKNNKEFKNFILDFEENCCFANNNIRKTSFLAEKFLYIPIEKLKNSVPKCNLTSINGINMENILKNFFNILEKENPEIIGGKIPKDDFYIKNTRK